MIAAVILLINQGQIGITILAIIIGLGSHYEWLKLKGKLSKSNLAISIFYFLIILFFKQINDSDLQNLFRSMSILIIVVLGANFTKRENKIFNFDLILNHIYISVPLLLFTLTPYTKNIYNHYNAMLPIMLMVLVWSSDSWAYVSGKLFGKHKLAPSISPGKTWEGLIGGATCAIVLGYFLFSLMPSTFPRFDWVIIAIIVAVFANVGDLIESQIKRIKGVKDSGKLLPGHGGVLDRFDGLLIALPLVIIYLIIF